MTRSTAGFTLVETLVALAVTATLATSGTLMMMQTLQASRAVDTRMEDVRALESANGLMRADFNEMTQRVSAAPDDLTQAAGFMGRSGREDGELMSFVREGWTDTRPDSGRSTLQRVTYRLEDGKLIRTAWLRPDPVRDTPVVERILFENIDQLTIHYRREGTWFDAWPAETDGQHPDLIELTLNFSDADVLTLAYMAGLTQ